MNFEDKLFGKPFKCVGLWWLLVARPPTESWFKVAPPPQASGFDFLNTRNVTINGGPSLGHLGHLFSHQEFYSLWWRLLSDMTCMRIEECLFMVYFLLLTEASLKRARLLPSLANIAQRHRQLLDNAHQIIATIRINLHHSSDRAVR